MARTEHYSSLHGRGVLVTGGADGIGAATVAAFARAGARVAFFDIQTDLAVALVEELADCDHQPVFIECDVTDLARVEAAVTQATEEVGPILTLVNNAALDDREAIEDISAESFDKAINVNLRHVIFTSKWVLPQMKANGGGAIVNMTSVAWMRGTFDMQVYATAKAGIVGFTNSLARQVGADGIRVNAIAPGLVVTERQKRLWWDPESLEKSVDRACLKELIYPEDVAKLALFLGSDESSKITKHCVLINGGSL